MRLALLASLHLASLLLPGAALAAPSPEEMVSMLRTIDERTQNNGDYTAIVFIETKEQGKSDLVYQAAVYRRDEADKLAILFTRPAAEAGKGYLRVDKNLFFFDPAVGKWERRTERERIGGTSSNRQDFDQSSLADDYLPAFVEDATLGALAAHHLELTAREGADVAYPKVQLWLDVATGNVLKRQDLALSGRLVRTTYYPKWQTMFSTSKGADVFFAKEIRIFDELQPGTTTTVVIQQVDLDPLDDSIFTKAWIESKSR